MDRANLAHLASICRCSTPAIATVFEFSERFVEREVPDPYYGGPRLRSCADLVEDAAMDCSYLMRQSTSCQRGGLAVE
jgi:protein-tyrosine-phosphatase